MYIHWPHNMFEFEARKFMETIFHLAGLLDVKAKGLGVCHGSHGKPESWAVDLFDFHSCHQRTMLKFMDTDGSECCHVRDAKHQEMPRKSCFCCATICYRWPDFPKHHGIRTHAGAGSSCLTAYVTDQCIPKGAAAALTSIMNPFLFHFCSQVARCCTPFPRSAKNVPEIQFQLAARVSVLS